jgi:hypothetical protein
LHQECATAGRNGVLRGFKFSLFDGGMYVPAMMSWLARIPGGARSGEVGMSMDILPTVSRAIGATVPGVDDSEILDVATEGAKSPHESRLPDFRTSESFCRVSRAGCRVARTSYHGGSKPGDYGRESGRDAAATGVAPVDRDPTSVVPGGFILPAKISVIVVYFTKAGSLQDAA